MTLGNAWGFVPNDHFKTSTKIIHNLIEIVAKGGSLLLGVGPDAQGVLQEIQEQRLREIGDWLKVNGAGIYATRTQDVPQDGEIFFTKGKDGARYALVRLAEDKPIPAVISWQGNAPKQNAKIMLLSEGKDVKWKQVGDSVVISLSANFLKKHVTYPALVFKY